MAVMQRTKRRTFASNALHYVYVQSVSRTADGEGGYDEETWSDVQRISASVNPIRARQQFEDRSVGVEATHQLRIRGHVDVSESNRIRFGSRYFEILTIEDLQERGIVKILTCKERR